MRKPFLLRIVPYPGNGERPSSEAWANSTMSRMQVHRRWAAFTNPTRMNSPDSIDCVVVGGGPAGLVVALYLMRFHRDIRVYDDARTDYS